MLPIWPLECFEEDVPLLVVAQDTLLAVLKWLVKYVDIILPNMR
jgi:hypothetical protein